MRDDDSGENYDIAGAGTYNVDNEDQLQREDSLVDRGVDDILDEGYSPPDRPRGAVAFGTTAAEQARGETLAMRLAQEEADLNLAFDDPLATPRDDDTYDDPTDDDDPDEVSGNPEVGDRRAGRLFAYDEGTHGDVEQDMVAGDVGIDSGAASAEEAAMHVVEEH